MDDSASTNPRFPPPRRVATAPTSLPEPAVASSSSTPMPPLSQGIVETLYSHPNVKIIAFTTSGRVPRTTGLPSGEAPGTLSWSSQIERTIAVGQFRIYRAPGSVSFLNCGSALQPILPKSQVWCIDEINSKFILQIRRPNYWRIELPVAKAEDKLRAEALRQVFDNILQFEKTECPFKRAFTVELPEPPETPVKYKPWTPVRRSQTDNLVAEEDDDDDDDDDDDEDSDDDSECSPVSSPDEVFTNHRATTPTPLRNRNTNDESDTQLSNRPESPSAPWYVRAQVDELETKIGIEGTEFMDISNATCPLRPSEMRGPENRQRDPKEPRSPVIDDSSWQQYDDFDYPQRTGSHLSSPQHDDDGPRHSNHRGGLFISTQFQNSPTDLPTPKAHAAPAARPGANASQVQDEGATEAHTETEDVVFELHEGTGSQGDQRKARLRRTAGFAITRSATLPAHAKLGTDKHSKSSTPQTLRGSTAGQSSRMAGHDSFHSEQSPRAPSVSQANANGTIIVDNDTASHGGDLSETGSEGGSALSHESVDTAPDDFPPIKIAGAFPARNIPDVTEESPATTATPQRPVTRHRATTGSISVRRRPFSPLPSAANLFAPAPPVERRPIKTKLGLPMTIILKTLEMLLGPPSYLIALMLKVAAKILAGEWRGLVFGYGDDGEEIPVQWDYSEGELSDLSDDDSYMGAPHGRSHRRRSRAATNEGVAVESPDGSDDSRNWGVD
ncbi:inheritance of peroxisomes protein 1-domain-containing protein [Dactylonectria estremocensis]|uniref:Inheritance of peroxisomes protein 1 n=1 Tax=Dactylonectria estremocensis TaxID=1079267 RepID=A0A9P9DZL2_9HYPO|nr:inheritance of peroxisomes protein 1-domain-containing protein [Dactylonectria estremocensis]